ncbi:MAG: hypothetical protein ACRCTQ_06085 [Brevinemataceae bacterium]
MNKDTLFYCEECHAINTLLGLCIYHCPKVKFNDSELDMFVRMEHSEMERMIEEQENIFSMTSQDLDKNNPYAIICMSSKDNSIVNIFHFKDENSRDEAFIDFVLDAIHTNGGNIPFSEDDIDNLLEFDNENKQYYMQIKELFTVYKNTKL